MGLRLDLDFGITPYQPRDLTAAWEGCHLPSEGRGVGYMGWCVLHGVVCVMCPAG